jgi:Family of unknown function (DUF5677)
MEAAETDDDGFPPVPLYSDDEVIALARRNEAQIVFFDWLKFASGEACKLAFMLESQPLLRPVPHIQYAVTTGLLNRICRLGRSIIMMTREQDNDLGEAVMVLQRSIFESCIRLSWLCLDSSSGPFDQYLADSIRNDLKLKNHIDAQVAQNNSKTLPVESRLLKSIENRQRATGLSDKALESIKALPNLKVMLGDVHKAVYNNSSLNVTDRTYLMGQTMGSHAVHGSWANLVANFLNETDEFVFTANGEIIETELSQFADISLCILEACISFILWRFNDHSAASQTADDLQFCRTEIHRQFLLIKEDEELRRLQNERN